VPTRGPDFDPMLLSEAQRQLLGHGLAYGA
jgi:hypothetical protein